MSLLFYTGPGTSQLLSFGDFGDFLVSRVCKCFITSLLLPYTLHYFYLKEDVSFPFAVSWVRAFPWALELLILVPFQALWFEFPISSDPTVCHIRST